MMFRKRIMVAGIAAAIASTAMPALASFTVIEKSAVKPVVPPQEVVEEGTRARAENERLRRELDQVKAELARVQGELTRAIQAPHAHAVDTAAINASLDQLERRLEETGAALLRARFGFGSAKFEPDADIGRTAVALAAKARQVNVRGHTDNAGSEAANRVMGFARANSVKRYLVNHGVPKGRIFVSSRGAAEPIGDNDSEAGRAANRRADIEFIR